MTTETIEITTGDHPTTVAKHASDVQAKRPYEAPALRTLGSVRELTEGGAGTQGDGFNLRFG